MAKETVKLNMMQGKVAAAIENDVKQQLTNGKNAMLRLRPYIEAVALGDMTPDHARQVMGKVRDKMIAHRKRIGDLRPVAPLQDSRVSEMKSILMLGEWKCWPTVLGYFAEHDMNFDDLKIVSKYVRKNVKGEAKNSSNAAPAKDRILREIKARKTQRRGTTERNPNAPVMVRNPEVTLQAMKRQAKGLAKWFGKDGKSADRFIDAIMKAVDAVTTEAKRVVKAREAAEA